MVTAAGEEHHATVVELIRTEIWHPIYLGTMAAQNLKNTLIGAFDSRGLPISELQMQRGMTSATELLFRMVGPAFTLGAHLWKKRRRKLEIELSLESRYLFAIEAQVLVQDRYSVDLIQSITCEVLDTLKMTEERARVDFGNDLCVSGIVRIFGVSGGRHFLTIHIKPGALEDFSRLWAISALRKIQLGQQLEIRRRCWLRRPRALRTAIKTEDTPSVVRSFLHPSPVQNVTAVG